MLLKKYPELNLVPTVNKWFSFTVQWDNISPVCSVFHPKKRRIPILGKKPLTWSPSISGVAPHEECWAQIQEIWAAKTHPRSTGALILITLSARPDVSQRPPLLNPRALLKQSLWKLCSSWRQELKIEQRLLVQLHAHPHVSTPLPSYPSSHAKDQL